MSCCEFEAQVRELAYQKWESAGCPLTTEDERNRFWFEAEQEIIKCRETKKDEVKAEII